MGASVRAWFPCQPLTGRRQQHGFAWPACMPAGAWVITRNRVIPQVPRSFGGVGRSRHPAVRPRVAVSWRYLLACRSGGPALRSAVELAWVDRQLRPAGHRGAEREAGAGDRAQLGGWPAGAPDRVPSALVCSGRCRPALISLAVVELGLRGPAHPVLYMMPVILRQPAQPAQSGKPLAGLGMLKPPGPGSFRIVQFPKARW
jgi:hypothetical protein